MPTKKQSIVNIALELTSLFHHSYSFRVFCDGSRNRVDSQDVDLDFHTSPELCLLVQYCFMSTETVQAIRDGEPRTSTSTFTQLLSSVYQLLVQYCFMSTETVQAIRDGEPRTATSTFTQLLNSDPL